MRLITGLSLAAILLLLGFSPGVAQEKAVEQVAILAPQPGQAVQGTLRIVAEIIVPGYRTAEISFAYENDPTQTWFLISEIPQPVSGDYLADWDTTILTDGNYKLRLVVTRDDAVQLTVLAHGIRVRNYSSIETSTPTATFIPAPNDTPQPTLTPTSTITPIPPTSTPLPENPAIITYSDISTHLVQGALGALAFFALAGVYGTFRRLLRP
jgi:hypothetical protein